MKKLPIVIAVVSGVFFAQASFAEARAVEASDKWQQFCEGTTPDNMVALNGRMKQLGEEGWELMSAGTGMACYKRPWRKGVDPIAALALPTAPAPAKVTSAKAPVVKPLVAKTAIAVVKPSEPEVESEPSPAIAAAAAEVMAAPSVTQAPAAKPSQAQAEPAAPSRSLLSDSPDQGEAPHARRALVPKS